MDTGTAFVDKRSFLSIMFIASLGEHNYNNT
jgi:hypothetical protein